MELLRAELINVVVDETGYSNKDRRRRCIDYLLQFGGVYCPKTTRIIVRPGEVTWELNKRRID